MVIQSFSDKFTANFFKSGAGKKGLSWASVAHIAIRKLDMLHYAAELNDLNSPPGNRLEQLKGESRGFHSIRINDQWRVLFRWSESDPVDVRITDYH